MAKSDGVGYNMPMIETTKVLELIRLLPPPETPMSGDERVSAATLLEGLRRYHEQQAPARSYLEGLNDEELRDVECIMYSGRDRDGMTYEQAKGFVPRSDRETTVSGLLSKSPLGQYLARGLQILEDPESAMPPQSPDDDGG